jgi:glyoxylase-like metal-dependent hydrolase (beta-lactamase superfamily II)
VAGVREIIPSIFTWPWFSERHRYNFNGHLIRDRGGNICIDPVEPDDLTLAEIVRAGAACIVLTNRNHVRAANLVRARTGARVAIHPADAGHARTQGAEVDSELQLANRVGPFVLVGVPSKSPGEVALHWPERRVLIVGDAVIGNPPGHCSLLPDAVIDDPAQLRVSVRRLLNVDFDVLLVGDGESILSGAKERLRALVESW